MAHRTCLRASKVALASRLGTQNFTSALQFVRGVCSLTRDNPSYKHLRRGNFAKFEDADAAEFERILPGRVYTMEDDVAPFNEDWQGMYRGSSSAVLRPRNTEEASAILAYCNSRRLAVNLQGGNTGLVGGSVPVFDEVVISTNLMNNVISLDEVSGVLTCQAGCVLQTLDQFLEPRGFMMPLDLGAKGSCQIGGNIATNAGGIRLLRYGSLHGSILGLEVVMPDGTVVNTLTGCRKDNTGYDLKQLFIGSEGTLGLVTSASIHCPQRPAAVNVAFLGCEDYDAVVRVFRTAKQSLGEVVSAFEFMDSGSMECVERNLGLKNAVSQSPFYVLLETHGSNDEHDQEKLYSFLESAMECGDVIDGTVAQDQTQAAAIWEVRESLAEALKKEGAVYKYDVSLPVLHLYSLVEKMSERVEGLAISCVGYGHLGDGNLHLNITSSKRDPEVLNAIEPFIYEYTSSLNGSISAEHGLGVMKAEKLHYSKGSTAIALMQSIKDAVDPNGIMNPYKVLPMV